MSERLELTKVGLCTWSSLGQNFHGGGVDGLNVFWSQKLLKILKKLNGPNNSLDNPSQNEHNLIQLGH